MKKKAVIILLFLPLFVFGLIAAVGIIMDTSRPPVFTGISITAARLITADGRETSVQISQGDAGRFVFLQNVNPGDRLAFDYTFTPYNIFEPQYRILLVSENIGLGLFESDATGTLTQSIGALATVTLTGARGDDWIVLRDSANRDINDRIRIIIR